MTSSGHQIWACLLRLIAGQRGRLQAAALLAVVTEILWLPQAALIALCLASLASGARVEPGQAALGVLALGGLRAGLGLIGARMADRAADAVIGTARQDLLHRAGLRVQDVDAPSSAAMAALVVDKLSMLRPYLLRWSPAQARVVVIPLLILAVVLPLSWVAAVILAISGPLIPLFMSLVGLAARDAAARQMDEIASLNGMLLERLAALVDIRLLQARGAMQRDFRNRADALRRQTMEVLRIAFLSSAVLELFSALGIAMMAVFVGFSLLGELDFGHWGTPLTLGEGLFMLLLAPAFFQPLRELAAAWHDRVAAQAVARDLLADEALAITEIPGRGGNGTPLGRDISATGLIVRGIAMPDFRIDSGAAIALTGASASGKTSLLLALAGLLPFRGNLVMGGTNLTAATADDWRAGMALVPQRVHFLDASLRENLTLGIARSDDEIAHALYLAQLGGLVQRLPEGLETRLGEQGAGLSGGEARRLTLARAALQARRLVLADEPTADLDDKTAAAVIAALLALSRKGATLIVATHDPRIIAALPHRIELGS